MRKTNVQNPTSEQLSSSGSFPIVFILPSELLIYSELGLIFIHSSTYLFIQNTLFPAKVLYALLFSPCTRINVRNVRNVVLIKKSPPKFLFNFY